MTILRLLACLIMVLGLYACGPDDGVPATSAPLTTDYPQYVEVVQLAQPNAKNEALSIAVPNIHSRPVCVHLRGCVYQYSGWRWYFSVINATPNPWRGVVTIFLLKDGRHALHEDLGTTEKPLPPSSQLPDDGGYIYHVDCQYGPKQMGGSITQYGWSLVTTHNP